MKSLLFLVETETETETEERVRYLIKNNQVILDH